MINLSGLECEVCVV